jgi:acetolactate synthase I/II/III large subunit
MNIQELQTISYYKLPVKIFILNNHGYLTIRHTQRNMLNGNLAGSSSETGVDCPNFENLSKAYGIDYYSYSHSSQLPQCMPEWLSHEMPAICEIIMPQEQLLVPKSGIKIRPDGKIYSPPLEDLYPYLGMEELEDNMIIPILKGEE